jgi:uncharacterized SAM-binding protein YcdF (DUF218 family)
MSDISDFSMTYDLVVLLGSRPYAEQEFPSHIIAALDKAAELYKNGVAPAIAVSGKWALAFDSHGIVPHTTESADMAAYLRDQGVPVAAIVQEVESKDTVANLYYLKQTVFQPRAARRLLFILGDFRVERVTYLVQKILGPTYAVDFMTVPSAPGEPYPHEADTLARTKYYLAKMKPGDEKFVKDMFYGHPFYTVPWPLPK